MIGIRLRLLCLAMIPLLAALALTGCGERAGAADSSREEEVSVRAAITEADPQAAVDKVYETLPDARKTALTTVSFRELFPGLEGVIDEYYGCTSSPNGGLSDVIILRPAEGSGNRDKARDALRGYQDSRILEFENYDILRSFEIAKEAVVFDQGDYVVLLMLADNDAAREIIDQYIPL